MKVIEGGFGKEKPRDGWSPAEVIEMYDKVSKEYEMDEITLLARNSETGAMATFSTEWPSQQVFIMEVYKKALLEQIHQGVSE
jgi:hypothetical protein